MVGSASSSGSGGGIRTPDLWVMSPTSCRCSTPRHVDRVVCGGVDWCVGLRGSGMSATASPPTGSPPQYSPALSRVTTGFGMGPGGASTLSATGTPHPPPGGREPPWMRHSRGEVHAPDPWSGPGPLSARPRALTRTTAPSSGSSRRGGGPLSGMPLPLARSAPRSLRDDGGDVDAGTPPSTIRTARLQSVARGPPAAYQPGHLPGVLPRYEWGCSSWGGIPA